MENICLGKFDKGLDKYILEEVYIKENESDYMSEVIFKDNIIFIRQNKKIIKNLRSFCKKYPELKKVI